MYAACPTATPKRCVSAAARRVSFPALGGNRSFNWTIGRLNGRVCLISDSHSEAVRYPPLGASRLLVQGGNFDKHTRILVSDTLVMGPTHSIGCLDGRVGLGSVSHSEAVRYPQLGASCFLGLRFQGPRFRV